MVTIRKMTDKIKSTVEISKLTKCAYPIYKSSLKKTTLKIADMLLNMHEIHCASAVFSKKFKKISFELSFCNDTLIQEINRDYRGNDVSTDVITFALFADDENAIILDNTAELGEIIISVDTLIRQASENNNTVEVELYTLITHGLLHLLGFDHLSQKDYDFVVGIQEAVVKNL